MVMKERSGQGPRGGRVTGGFGGIAERLVLLQQGEQREAGGVGGQGVEDQVRAHRLLGHET